MPSFWLNGQWTSVEVDPDRTLLEVIRGPLGLSGTKEGCGEGDCGACTVVIGTPEAGRVRYRAVTSCLVPAWSVQGRIVITVEGIGTPGALHPVQKALLEAHAVQCGYCTPGVVMSLLALFLDTPSPSDEEIRAALEGNLCRCTGYLPIRQAAEAIRSGFAAGSVRTEEIRPPWLAEVEVALSGDRGGTGLDGDRWKSPGTPEEVDRLLADLGPRATLVAGATDVQVARRTRGTSPGVWVDLSRVAGLADLAVEADRVRVGAAVRLEDLRKALDPVLPPLAETIRTMCSRPVRHLATLAGNLINASPVADTVPLLLVLDATVRIRGLRGRREVPVSRFLQGYRQVDRAPDEWVEAIEIPRADGDFVHFEKASRRRELDIATVNSALRIRWEGGRVREARLAFGGVAPTTVLCPRAADRLRGRPWTWETAEEAARTAMEEVTPIGDVRGSAEFRRRLVHHLVLAHFRAWQESSGGTP